MRTGSAKNSKKPTPQLDFAMKLLTVWQAFAHIDNSP